MANSPGRRHVFGTVAAHLFCVHPLYILQFPSLLHLESLEELLDANADAADDQQENDARGNQADRRRLLILG